MCDTLMENKLTSITKSSSVPLHKIHLFFSYYHDNNPQRASEIDMCTKINVNNQLFDKIYIINETHQEINFLTPSERIVIVDRNRMTFGEFFRYSNSQTDEHTINMLINTDIVVGANFDQINLSDHQMICLSRHEITPNGQQEYIEVGGGSHDCWIWKGKIVDNIGDFYMGKFFCDGVIANQLAWADYIQKNPALDLKIYHVHASNIRNYSNHDVIHGHRNGVKFSHNDNIFTKNDMYWDGCN